MNKEEIMQKLEELGSEQTKRIYMNHGSKEPLYGVKIADMKKIGKGLKNNNQIAMELYKTGNHDAMYLAGLIVNTKEMTKDDLLEWMQGANSYTLSEYTVADVAAETSYAVELAKYWIKDQEELVASGGWSTYSNYLSIVPSERIDIEEVRQLLKQIKETIHEQQNRVKYTMNGFVISVGAYIPELVEEALRVAEEIGKVKVYLGKTSCKVPEAQAMIQKVVDMGKCGKKRKTCRA